MGFADDLEWEMRQQKGKVPGEDLFSGLAEAERMGDRLCGRTPFEQWPARAQERMMHAVYGRPDSVEREAVATCEEHLRQVEQNLYSARQAGYNKGWAEASVKAHRRLKRVRLFWFLAGAVVTAIVAFWLSN